MIVVGHVANGVVVLDGDATLPEGARVIVSELSHVEYVGQSAKPPADLPLVSGGEPGSVRMTNQRIYEILDEEDIAGMKQTWNVSS